MPWIQIRLYATAKNANKLSNMLMGLGAQAVTYMDAQDNPVYEPLPGETKLWGETQVTGLFDAEEDPAPIIAFFQRHFGKQMPYKVEQLEDKDWVREWMDHFHPMQFGERLWICPSWRDVPDPDAVNVMLDPGLAFGTGTHPTTALCLQWLDSIDLTGKTVVDFGCGSGILAIAALKLGAARVIGIDIDPQAIQASRDNAERNGVADKLELFLPEDQPAGLKADILVANILAGPLRELAPLMNDLVRPAGLLALSGVLETQAVELEQIYGQWFEMDPTAVREEWCRLSGTKR
jgi:ribosomal protein L11 methyltransferase